MAGTGSRGFSGDGGPAAAAEISAIGDLFTDRQLVALAGQHSIPILEDDYVGDLRYEGRAQPALKALDPSGGVIYVSTFSKMLMPLWLTLKTMVI